LPIEEIEPRYFQLLNSETDGSEFMMKDVEKSGSPFLVETNDQFINFDRTYGRPTVKRKAQYHD